MWDPLLQLWWDLPLFPSLWLVKLLEHLLHPGATLYIHSAEVLEQFIDLLNKMLLFLFKRFCTGYWPRFLFWNPTPVPPGTLHLWGNTWALNLRSATWGAGLSGWGHWPDPRAQGPSPPLPMESCSFGLITPIFDPKSSFVTYKLNTLSPYSIGLEQ